MDITTLKQYRDDLYHCFTSRRDALFEVTDALLSYPIARSFVELSEAECVRRKWSSLYQAMDEGRIGEQKLIEVWARYSPYTQERMVLGLDTVPIHRPLAHTYADRTWVHVPNLPPSSRPVKPGWEFSTLGLLPAHPSSRVYWLDTNRVDSTHRAIDVGVSQLDRLLPQLGQSPIVLCDARYASAAWIAATKHLNCSQLIRTASNRRLYRPPPPPAHKGRPRKDGQKFQGKDESSYFEPHSKWEGIDRKGKTIKVSCWQELHLQRCRDVEITVIRVRREAAADTKRDPKDSWFWWVGGGMPSLESIPDLYARRYSLEHAYRFDKQDLLLDKPHLHTPEQMSRWLMVVAAVHNELLLAEPLLEVEYHPWDRRDVNPSPRQLRRGVGRIIAYVGTPVGVVQPRGKSPGRPKGARVTHKAECPVLTKPGNKPTRPHPPPLKRH